MNLRKGLRRLALGLSIVSFPVAGLISSIVASWYWDAVDYIAFTLGWGIFGFIAVWIICRWLLYVIEGFQGVEIKQENNVQISTNAKGKIRRIALFLAIAAAIVGAVIGVSAIIGSYQAAHDDLQTLKDQTHTSIFELLRTSKEIKNLEEGFWVNLSSIELLGLCILASLAGVSIAFIVTWLIVWFTAPIIYRWFILGFRDEETS